MKRTLRLFTAVIFTVFMVMSMSVTAIAAEGDFTITINKPTNDKANHTYDGYRIFAGTLAQDGSLTEVTWGAGIADGDDFIADLKADTTVGSAFTSATKASDVAKALEGKDNDGPFMQAFAKVVSANLGTKAFSEQASPITVAKADAGYYFIKDKDNSFADPGYGAYSRFILKVVGNVELTAKADVPTFDKNIVEDGEKVKNNTASVGDKVNYQIDSKVPDMTGYTKYFFVVEDEMTTGLTFNDDIKVTIGTKELDKDDDYTVTSTAHSFKLVLKNFINYNTGDDIKIEYSATLNKDANITEGTNDNTANLTYSNNPNITPNSTTDEPGPGDVTGKTPDIKTVTGTSGIQIDKIDGGTSAALSGAKFMIEGKGVKAVIVNGTVFKKSDAGTHYMLKNGSFTDEAPTDQTKKNYDSITTKYAEVKVDNTLTSAEGINNIGYTKAPNGYLSFAGLDAGEYTITELEAPEGYNKLPDTITVTLSAQYNANDNRFVWTCKMGNTTVDSQIDGCYHFQVANNKGATLPGTGGMGTTIFYVVGGLLIVCAGALLVTKIRMGKKEEE